MVKETIRIFARLKTLPKGLTAGQYDLLNDQEGIQRQISLNVPRDVSKGIVNNRKQNHKFSFEQIFDLEANQGEVFTAVAKPVIDQVLQGYNGTVFAYGQTGSGKTYTITGGGTHESRGIIPLTVDYIFRYYKQNHDVEFTTQVSYLEIYNEVGRDLLSQGDVRGIDDLSKVTPMEDVDQNVHLKNLSIHTVTSREEALDLLFQGDFNRVVAATPMNPGSTRSHCIYTIHITSRPVGSSSVRRAKFHLVDLAGSERVSKTGASGVLLTEAKFINESLHHLEKVIVALSEPGRSHIPYRDSILTNVLRDSLGGNCMTTMVATCSVEKRNLDETISTCRFAQRVAMIKNDVELNEEVDPKLLMDRLRREIGQLKEELALLTGEQRSDALTEEDISRCENAVGAFLEDSDPDAILSVGSDMRKIQFCFQLMKKELSNSSSADKQKNTSDFEKDSNGATIPSSYESKELQKLCSLLQQRDNEISILVNLLKKEKLRGAVAAEGSDMQSEEARDHRTRVKPCSSSSSCSLHSFESETSSIDGRPHELEHHGHRVAKLEKFLVDGMSIGRKEAFELFKRNHRLCAKVEMDRKLLKQQHLEARQLGEELKQLKAMLGASMEELEKHRALHALERDSENRRNFGAADDREASLKLRVVEQKKSFQELVSELKLVKEKCDHLEQSLEKDKLSIVRSFEQWWADQETQHQRHKEAAGRPSGERGDHSSVQRTPSYSSYTIAEPETSADRSRFSSPSTPSTVTRQPPYRGSPDADESTWNKNFMPPLSGSKTMSTGDPEVDENIKKFYIERQKVLKQQRPS